MRVYTETKRLLRILNALWLRLEVIAGLTILAGLISVAAVLHGAVAGASALDLSPVTNTVNDTVSKPVSSLPVVGKPLADTTDKLLTDTVPSTTSNLTRNLPTPVNKTLNQTVKTVNEPVKDVAGITRPLTDGLGDTISNTTESLPAPVNGLLGTLESPVRGLTNNVQDVADTLPQVTDTAAEATAPVTTPVNNMLERPTQAANNTVQPILNNMQNGLRNLPPLNNPAPTGPQANTSGSTPNPRSTTADRQEMASTAVVESTQPSTAASAPFLSQVGSFFSTLLPVEAQAFFDRIARDGIDFKPYLFSMAIFVIMVITLIGTTYAEERGKFKFLTDGDNQLAELARVYDIPQLSLLVFTIIGSGAIVFYILAV